MKNKKVLFTSLAMYQAPFFVGLAREFERQGYQPAIISFHQRSVDYIESRGIKGVDAFSFKNDFTQLPDEKIEKLFSNKCDVLEIANPRLLLSHEMVTFRIRNSLSLKRKFLFYSKAIESFIDSWAEENDEVLVIQETGGFVSLLSTFYISLKNNFHHLFLEPSLYRGRINACYNDFLKASYPKTVEIGTSPPQEAIAYLQETLKFKNLVIPHKDKAAYKSPLKKVLNLYNFKRLLEKSFDKLILKKQEEFSHVGNYVHRHLKMVVNRYRFLKLYKPLPEGKKFIYYPFHVPIDMALTLRSPEFLDQYALVDYLSRGAPKDCLVVVKEHPAMIGFLSYPRMKELCKHNDNLIFLDPSVNNLDLMKKASAIVTVNSKSGAEAIIQKKNVISLGHSFYSDSKMVTFCRLLRELPDYLNEAIKKKDKQENDYNHFVSQTWENSFPGELYSDDSENVQKTVTGIQYFLELVKN